MLPMKRLTAATTTSTPRIVGYQRSRSLIPSAARTSAFTRAPPLEAPLEFDDLVDLGLGHDRREVRHATGGDAAHAVALVLLDAVGHPFVLLLEPRRLGVVGREAGELLEHGAATQGRAEGTATSRRGFGDERLGRVVVGPALRVATRAIDVEE